MYQIARQQVKAETSFLSLVALPRLVVIPMMLTFLLAYLLVFVFQLTLHALNNRYLQRHGETVPPPFVGLIDGEALATASAYTLAKGRLSLLRSVVDAALTLIFLFTGPLAWYDGWIAGFELGFIVSGLLFFLLLSVAQSLVAIPFDLYHHFRLESRYGFNRMTFKLWFVDQLKGMLLSLIFFGLLGSGALWLVQAAPQSWWLWVWGLLVGFGLLMTVISPYLIEPLFFKFEPLKLEGLEEAIRGMMSKAGLSVSKVLQVDASKRSGHSNAYFTGLGKQKRVVLFDTLLAQLRGEEILAVLAHELGHMVKRHIRKRLLLMATLALGFCFAAFWLVSWTALPQLVGMEEASFYARVLIVTVLAGIVTFPLTPISSARSRRDEDEADDFAVELHGNGDDLATALLTMSKENLSNLHPHPFYARWYYSHPPVVARVERLRRKD